jgi:predicted transcriptional regulator
MSIINHISPKIFNSDEEREAAAIEFIEVLFPYFPLRSEFQIMDVIRDYYKQNNIEYQNERIRKMVEVQDLIDTILIDENLAERDAPNVYSIKLTKKGRDKKQNKEQEKEPKSHEEICISVLKALKSKGDEMQNKMSSILTELNIDALYANGIETELKNRELIETHDMGCFINLKGEAYLTKHDLGGTIQQQSAAGQQILYIGENKGNVQVGGNQSSLVIRDQKFSNSDPSQNANSQSQNSVWLKILTYVGDNIVKIIVAVVIAIILSLIGLKKLAP